MISLAAIILMLIGLARGVLRGVQIILLIAQIYHQPVHIHMVCFVLKEQVPSGG
jgi:hypothetical protein